MVLRHWQLGLVNRSADAGVSKYPNLFFTEATDGSGNLISVIAPPTNPMQAQNDPRAEAGDSTPPPSKTIIITPHGYALLENYNPSAPGPGTGDAGCRPACAGFVQTGGKMMQTGIWSGPDPTNPNTCDVYVPGLQLVMANTAGANSVRGPSQGGELVLLRPRRADGELSASTDPLNTFDEGKPAHPNLYDMVPVDSYDFTGLSVGTSPTPNAWSYIRFKGGLDASSVWFRQIYPGRYFAEPAPAPREGRTGTRRRTIGTDVETINAPSTNSDPTTVTTWIAPPQFGQDVTPTSPAPAICSYINNFPPIQVYNVYRIGGTSSTVQGHWPNPTIYPAIPDADFRVTPAISANPQAPYGTFARNGDLLDIPFIGAYRITLASQANTPTSFVELNSLPRDSSMADATYTDAAHRSVENVGRFCPLGSKAVPGTPDYYSWASNLFSYLTVQSPSDAFLPNFDADINDVTTPRFEYEATNPDMPPAYKYPPASTASNPAAPPSVVLTADPTAANQLDQGAVGVEGLVNINTASWKVLSMLPMITKNELGSLSTDNETLAKMIVTWRMKNGPFMSIFDLNKVTDPSNSASGFQTALTHLNIAAGGGTGGVNTTNGLLTPPDQQFPGATPISNANLLGVSSGVAEDYQSDFAMLSRISNLITTRSDTFTVYVEVQGWANAGTSAAKPIITRRYAYIADRSEINGDPRSRFVRTVTVPTE